MIGCQRDGCTKPARPRSEGRGAGNHCSLLCRVLHNESVVTDRITEKLGDTPLTQQLHSALVDACAGWSRYCELTDELVAAAESVGIDRAAWSELVGVGHWHVPV